jgi:hypothetical protein
MVSVGLSLVIVLLALVKLTEVGPWLAERVTTFAASCLVSPEEKKRYGEEWLADLAYCTRRSKKLVVALGHLAAARRLRGRILRREFRSVLQLTKPLLADVVVDDDVVARLQAALTEPRFGSAWPATAAITSNAGVGAAAFAATVAKQLGTSFKPPVVVEFGKLGSHRDPVAALLAALRVRRVPMTAIGRRRLSLRLTATRKRPIVAVNLQGDRAIRRLLLAVAAPSPVLITGRRKPEILVYNVVSVAPPGALSDWEALVLLAHQIGNYRVTRHYNTAAAICREVGNHPDGIKLIGQYLRARPDLSLRRALREVRSSGSASFARSDS